MRRRWPSRIRSESLALIKQYTDLRIRLDHEVPGSKQFDETSDASQKIQNQLWALAGDALNASPVDSAPRLYVETLNDMIDAHTTRCVGARQSDPDLRVAVADRRRPQWRSAYSPCTWRCSGRGVLTVFLAAALITIVVLVMFDLDRPSRGFIRVPDTPLVALEGIDGSASGGGRTELVTLVLRHSGVTTSRLSSAIVATSRSTNPTRRRAPRGRPRLATAAGVVSVVVSEPSRRLGRA